MQPAICKRNKYTANSLPKQQEKLLRWDVENSKTNKKQ
jgi:hypothetical protein